MKGKKFLVLFITLLLGGTTVFGNSKASPISDHSKIIKKTLAGGVHLIIVCGKVDSKLEETSNEPAILVRVPPKDWDPFTATDEELEYYFYPIRPKDPVESVKLCKMVDSQK